jgi:hypothetical protein
LNTSPPRFRRLVASAIDLWHAFSVALLPAVIGVAVILYLQVRMVNHEVARADALPHGIVPHDPETEAKLAELRASLLARVTGRVEDAFRPFLDQLRPLLEHKEELRELLSRLLELVEAARSHASRAVGQATARAAAETVSHAFLEALREYIRAEVDYRLSQLGTYFGVQSLAGRIRDLVNRTPGQLSAEKPPETPPKAGPGGPPAFTRWTNLADKVLSQEVRVLPGTQAYLGSLPWLIRICVGLALLYLALRDLVGGRRSLGKRIMNLRVVDARHGGEASRLQLTLRGALGVLLFPVEALLAALGVPRLGDRLARTRVVIEEPAG